MTTDEATPPPPVPVVACGHRPEEGNRDGDGSRAFSSAGEKKVVGLDTWKWHPASEIYRVARSLAASRFVAEDCWSQRHVCRWPNNMRIYQCDLGERFWSMAEVGYTWATSGSPLGSRAVLRASVTIHPSIHSMRPSQPRDARRAKGRANASNATPRAPSFLVDRARSRAADLSARRFPGTRACKKDAPAPH